jgi:hypothetical protein
MGSKPDKPKEPESNKALAEGAAADYVKFQAIFNPALIDLRDQASSDSLQQTLVGRANATAMQALTANPSYEQTQSIGGSTGSGAKAMALGNQIASARSAGRAAQNQLGANVLATRSGQSGVAARGLSQLARMDTEESVDIASANNLVKGAKAGAIGQIAMAGGLKAGEAGMFGKSPDTTDFFKRFARNIGEMT